VIVHHHAGFWLRFVCVVENASVADRRQTRRKSARNVRSALVANVCCLTQVYVKTSTGMLEGSYVRLVMADLVAERPVVEQLKEVPSTQVLSEHHGGSQAHVTHNSYPKAGHTQPSDRLANAGRHL
jgi:hypothetical protein